MDPNSQRLTQGASGGASAQKVYVEDVFSTYLYTGNGSTATITNGIDLSGKGGLVWIKDRVNANLTAFWYNHFLFDSERGSSSYLSSNLALSENHTGYIGTVPFLSNGFSSGAFSQTGANYASWAFRKQDKFFDVITYTGNGSNRTIAHNLGSIPGFMMVKCTSAANGWAVYHRSNSAFDYYPLETTDGATSDSTVWNATHPTSSVFSVGTNTRVNANGQSYVAYLFANNAGGFGETGNDNVITCGNYNGNGSANGTKVTLGWEPQWVLIRRANGGGYNWQIYDNMRGVAVGSNDAELQPNTSSVETSANKLAFLSDGFQLETTDAGLNGGSTAYIYIAIRRGPMKTPTDATKVFGVQTANQTGNGLYVDIGSPLDALWIGLRGGSANNALVRQRLTGSNYLVTSTTASEVSNSAPMWQTMLGAGGGSVGTDTTQIGWGFRRAPGFFDVVCYSGSTEVQNINHNLGVVPEMIITKARNGSTVSYTWTVYAEPVTFASSSALYLSRNDANLCCSNGFWNSTSPTSSVFTVAATSHTGLSGYNYVAYLFASCPGVSKIGAYTGTAATLQVDCGFTNGARFVMIKRTDSTGDWYVWDTTRGIISGNDPYLLLNSTATEVTNTDYIDPLSSGFEISSTAPAAINANGGSYIFLAIA